MVINRYTKIVLTVVLAITGRQFFAMAAAPKVPAARPKTLFSALDLVSRLSCAVAVPAAAGNIRGAQAAAPVEVPHDIAAVVHAPAATVVAGASVVAVEAPERRFLELAYHGCFGDDVISHENPYRKGGTLYEQEGALLEEHDKWIIRRYFIPGMNINATNEYKESMLYLIACFDNLRIARFLVEHGADVTIQTDIGETALHAAARYCRLPMVQLLIDSGADVSARDNNGLTPLICAAHYGHLDTIKYLDEQGADINVRDGSGRTPLMCAAWMGHLEVVKYLVAHGAYVWACDERGETALDVARQWGRDDVVHYLESVMADLRRAMTPKSRILLALLACEQFVPAPADGTIQFPPEHAVAGGVLKEILTAA